MLELAFEFAITIDIYLTYFDETIRVDVDVVAGQPKTVFEVTDVDLTVIVNFNSSSFDSVVWTEFSDAFVIAIVTVLDDWFRTIVEIFEVLFG